MSFIQNLSVFIPRIHREDANETFIKRVFYDQEIACVRRIDFLKCRDSVSSGGKVYYQAKLYFHFWFKNQIAYNVQRRILKADNYGARVIYADPWYWIVLKNINPMTEKELCVNERLEYLEKTVSKQSKELHYVTEQMASLQTDVEQLKEQAKTKIPQNTHIRFCYAKESVQAPTTPEWYEQDEQDEQDDYEKLFPTWNLQLKQRQNEDNLLENNLLENNLLEKGWTKINH